MALNMIVSFSLSEEAAQRREIVGGLIFIAGSHRSGLTPRLLVL